MTNRLVIPIAASTGIHSLTLRTPYPIGTVNVCLIEGDPLTLVDCGARAPIGRASLGEAVAALGYRLKDIGRLLLTHQHVDHVGLASDLVGELDLEVACLSALADYLENWPEACAADETFRAERMARHGAPASVVEGVRARGETRVGEAGSVRVTRRLEDGDVVEAGASRFRVLHRPGHSPSDTVFWDEAGSVAIVGDHLLAGISSNALMSRPLPGAGRFRPLLEYRRSLLATRELRADLLLTGHGKPIDSHSTLVDERLARHDERAQLLAESLERKPRQTAWELAVGLFGDDVVAAQSMLCFSETIGHLEYLEEQGRVLREDGPPVRFAAA